MPIKPTIGRVVLVHRGMSDQPEPAMISYVWNDGCINVGGFDRNGVPFAATSVQLLQDDETPRNPRHYAEWMPYQKGQAAKTEQLESAIAGASLPGVRIGSGDVAPGGPGENSYLPAETAS